MIQTLFRWYEQQREALIFLSFSNHKTDNQLQVELLLNSRDLFTSMGRLGCPKKHQSCLIKLQMQILVLFDLKTMPDFFQEF